SIYYRSASTGTYDVAENYQTSDVTLNAGSIATLDIASSKTIKTASGSSIPIGIISSDPGLTLGGADSTANPSTARPLALSGRVPVKVSLANGPIAIGDRLMLSTTTPGVAVKALRSGETIGIALENYTTASSTGRIETFVSSRYWFAPTDIAIDPLNGHVGFGTTTSAAYQVAVGGDVAATGFVNVSTRTSKKDITYIDEEKQASMLEKINNMMIAEYHYSNEATSSPKRLGLIAEEAPTEVLSSDGKGVDLYKLLSMAIGAIQSLAEKVSTIGETLAGFAKSFTTENLSASEIRTEKLCVGDTCVSKEELQALLVIAKAGSGAPVASASIDGNVDQPLGDSSAPVIILLGNNPSTIRVGDTYADLGATVTDNVDKNLGIKMFVNDVETSVVNIDTSIVGSHTVRYVATDQVGNTASRIRTVIVEAVAPTTVLQAPIVETPPPPTAVSTTTLSAPINVVQEPVSTSTATTTLAQ
ncbi:DUF5011 domain-containing protein, partial [Patescibacteria group bacterium]